jgi:hypothetical protein
LTVVDMSSERLHKPQDSKNWPAADPRS